MLDNDTLYKDFNDTYDYIYNAYPDYDNYETTDNDEFSTMSYYEEQDIKNVNDSEIHYDANSTIVTDFLIDSTIDEHFYTSSISSQDETTVSTTIEDTVEGTLDFLYILILYIIFLYILFT